MNTFSSSAGVDDFSRPAIVLWHHLQTLLWPFRQLPSTGFWGVEQKVLPTGTLDKTKPFEPKETAEFV